jgi:hypothetical protein
MKPKNSGLAPRSSRRSMLKSTMVGVTGLGAAGGLAAVGAYVVQKITRAHLTPQVQINRMV